jgi:hypothetical protein
MPIEIPINEYFVLRTAEEGQLVLEADSIVKYQNFRGFD